MTNFNDEQDLMLGAAASHGEHPGRAWLIAGALVIAAGVAVELGAERGAVLDSGMFAAAAPWLTEWAGGLALGAGLAVIYAGVRRMRAAHRGRAPYETLPSEEQERRWDTYVQQRSALAARLARPKDEVDQVPVWLVLVIALVVLVVGLIAVSMMTGFHPVLPPS